MKFEEYVKYSLVISQLVTLLKGCAVIKIRMMKVCMTL